MIAGILVMGILSGLAGTTVALASGYGILTSVFLYIPGSFLGVLLTLAAMVALQRARTTVTIRAPGPVALAVRSDGHAAASSALLPRN